MTLTLADRADITDVIHLHGHLTDHGELDDYHLVFTPGVHYDVTALGGTVLTGIDALRTAADALGTANPVGHHVTGVIVTGIDADHARARSKAIGINADGTAASLSYDDTLVRTPHGWRIDHRVITPHRTPLGGRYDT